MDDLLSRISKRLLISSANFLLFGLFVALIIVAGFIGFAFDFGNCFGQSSCSNGAGMYTLLLPAGVLFGGVFILKKWRVHKNEQYRQSIKEEVVAELGIDPINLPERICELLKVKPLSLDEITSKTSADKQVILEKLKQLLKDGVVTQQLEADYAIFSLK